MAENSKERLVYLRRKLPNIERAQGDPSVKDYFRAGYRALGSYWKGNVIATGMSKAELELLMPNLHNVDPEDKTAFRKANDKYFHEITTTIDGGGGTILNVGLPFEGEPLSEKNLPNSINNYVTYRHAIGHPSMAKNEQEATSNPTKLFYLYDPLENDKQSVELGAIKDEAMQLFFDIKDKEGVVDQVLTLLGKKIKHATKAAKIKMLREVATRESVANEAGKIKGLTDFIEKASDKDLEFKYLIEEMISAQTLERVGQRILWLETGEELGVNMKDAVAYLKDKKNSKDLNSLKARYKELVKS